MDLENPGSEARFLVLRELENNPTATQRELADKLGISLGKVNYCLKGLAQVGWIKANNFARSKNKAGYVYVLTPKGIREKALLTLRYLERKQKQYERLKVEIEELKRDVERNE